MKLLSRKLAGQNPHEAGLSLLEALYGKPLPEIRRTALGKPYFVDCPMHFSVSHTKNHVFCALSEHPVGIDAEELDRNICLDLAEKILSPCELAEFHSAENPRLALLTFWVLKEAEAKCTGKGLAVYPNHTSFSLNDPRVREIDGCLVAVIEENDDAV